MTHTLNQGRGYVFENFLVKCYSKDGYIARRLGGSSVGLPDIIATNNDKSILISIEAKSTTGDNAYVPHEEIVRCFSMLDMFSVYGMKAVLLAFKFIKTKERKLKYHFFMLLEIMNLSNIKSITCNYGGELRFNKRDKNAHCGYRWEKIQIESID